MGFNEIISIEKGISLMMPTTNFDLKCFDDKLIKQYLDKVELKSIEMHNGTIQYIK